MDVTAAKPGVGGGLWMAPAGTSLPTDATTALGSAFASLGHISDQGVARNISRDNQVIKAWGGQTVAVLNGGKTETFKFKTIDFKNTDVLGIVFGEASGDLTNGITVKSTGAQGEPHVFVISTILADDVHQRIVIPSAVVTEISEIKYVDNDVIGYEITLTAIADSNDVTAYEYMAAQGATGATGASN